VAEWRVHGPEEDRFKWMERHSKESRGLKAHCRGGQGLPRALAPSGGGYVSYYYHILSYSLGSIFYQCIYIVLFLFNNVIYVFLLLWLYILIVCLCMATLTEVFPCFFLGCKANARVKPTKMGHSPHSSQIFVLFYVLFVLCCSVHCLCVNVYCTTATGWLPNCS
jgi:magnesium-transporting ATPase (P-type)